MSPKSKRGRKPHEDIVRDYDASEYDSTGYRKAYHPSEVFRCV